MKNKPLDLKPLVVSVLLLGTIAVVFLVPKPKYQGSAILTQIKVPLKFAGWTGKDTSEEAKSQADKNEFISMILSYEYTNAAGEIVYFSILDAGNFHNPKICMGGAGYINREMPDVMLTIKDHAAGPAGSGEAADRGLRATAVYFGKGNEGILTAYWIMIDKEQVDWTKQKMKEFFYSLLNKRKVGLMVRLDIPTSDQGIPRAQELAREFVAALYPQLPLEQREYIFGK